MMTCHSETRNKEEWRKVPECEGYEVSSHGRVRSSKKGGRILKPELHYQGYWRIMLRRVPVVRFRIHRLVAEAFLPNPLDLPIVNHIDRDKGHNCVANLEWCTQSENVQHYVALDRQKAQETANIVLIPASDLPW